MLLPANFALHAIKVRLKGGKFKRIFLAGNSNDFELFRRIAVGTRTGQMAMYEMRGVNKTQMINAHQGRITAVAFGPDGKTLATFSAHDNKLYFWQTSTSMFGLGNAQTKCTKSYNVAPHPQAANWNPTYTPKLVWISPRTVTLLLPDGTENRFNC